MTTHDLSATEVAQRRCSASTGILYCLHQPEPDGTVGAARRAAYPRHRYGRPLAFRRVFVVAGPAGTAHCPSLVP